MEACHAYEPWHDKATHRTFLRPTPGKCLHYDFYFMDETLGLIYLRVPTGSPFRLQFYCNGHRRRARALTRAGIDYAIADNAFLRIDDPERAQALADAFSPDRLHAILDHDARLCCPVLDGLGPTYHGSLTPVEYSTDGVFRSEACCRMRLAFLDLGIQHPTQVADPVSVHDMAGTPRLLRVVTDLGTVLMPIQRFEED
jgi:hypothetical protein